MRKLISLSILSCLTSCNPAGETVTFGRNYDSVGDVYGCYYREVIKDDPVFYLRFSESSGSKAAGSGILATEGSLTDVTMAQESPITSETNTSFDFNGTSSVVDLGNESSLAITGDQTIEMWLRPTSTTARRNPFARAYGGTGTITFETNRRLNYFYGTSGVNGAPYQGFVSSTSLTLNQWSHVVLVRDLTNMKLHWYINGVLSNTTNANYASAVAGTNDTFIGQGYVDNFEGGIDELAVYDSALSSETIALHYDRATSCE